MGNYSELKDLINNPTSHGLPAWDNGDNKIEGEMMKSYLLSIVNSLSSGGYLFKGVAKLTPTQTDPGTPDQNVFYIASEQGTYTNFPISGGYLQVAENEVAIFKYNGTWSKEVTGIPFVSSSQNSQTGREELTIGNIPVHVIEKLQDSVYGPVILDNSAYSTVSKEMVSNSDYFVIVTNVASAGDTITYTGGFAGSLVGLGLGYFSAELEHIDSKISSGTRVLTAPANTAIIFATIKKNTAGNLLINGVDATFSLLDSTISLLSDVARLQGKTVELEGGNVSYGVAIRTDNTTVVNEDFAVVTFPVVADDVIEYTGGFSGSSSGQYPYYGIVIYKSDGTVDDNKIASGTRTITVSSAGVLAKATIKKSASYAVKVNGVNVIEFGTISELRNEVDSLSDNVDYLMAKEDRMLPINIFGDVLPAAFKTKLEQFSNDLLIVCQGDSLTAAIDRTSPQTDPAHCPPGQSYKGWPWLLQYYISKTKPICDRVDSQRNNVDVFTKTGTWENVATVSPERLAEICGNDGSTYGQQRTMAAETFQCSDSNAAIAFEFDADIYEKCNIVFSKEPDAVLTKIVISEGSGKMLVSEDRTTWVEANGFTYNQRTPIAEYNLDTDAINGNANRQPQRRLWMKKVAAVTGIIHISYQRDNTTPYENSYMYCWGIEKWTGVAIFVDNVGRGGRTTKLLKANISDIFDRNPDLAIFEMPLANEIGASGTPLSIDTLKGANYYQEYFLGTNGDSFKQRSNDYTTLPLIVILPHGRSGYWDDANSAIVWNGTNGAPAGQPAAYTCYKQLFGWLKNQLSPYAQVKFINLFDQLIDEALVLNDKIKDGFYVETGGRNQITYDTIHLNDYGAELWVKYLAGIFQV